MYLIRARDSLLNADINPTPNPAKNRPATNKGISLEAVCRITPKEKMTRVTSNPILLPRKSPSGAADSAPKKVPADRIETISEDCEALMPGAFVSGSIYPVEKVSSQCGMAMMPPMVPVS